MAYNTTIMKHIAQPVFPNSIRTRNWGIFALLLVLLFACAACAPEEEEPPVEPAPLAPVEGEAYQDGGQVLCMSSSLELDPQFVAEQTGILPRSMVFTSTTSVAINYLMNGGADRLFTVLPVADFYAARSERLHAVECAKTVDLSMLVAYSEPELVDVLNQALADIKEDGTLDALYAAWVTAFEAEGRPENTEDPVVFEPSESEQILRIGFSGTLPLVDYILDDGAPGGFTAALFNELQARTGYTIVSKHVLPESKISALLNDQIDVYLWHFLEVPEVVFSTEPYLTMPLAFLEVDPQSDDPSPGDASGE